jgi:hypothetical protein
MYSYYATIDKLFPETAVPEPTDATLHITTRDEKISAFDPKVWGPPFWFILHTSAAYYPVNPSPYVREKMKERIMAIPYEIPCELCRNHAVSFVESKKNTLEQIVSNRHDLFQFYVDFHNNVNKRHGKKEYTYDEAYKMYSGTVTANRFSYN